MRIDYTKVGIVFFATATGIAVILERLHVLTDPVAGIAILSSIGGAVVCGILHSARNQKVAERKKRGGR